MKEPPMTPKPVEPKLAATVLLLRDVREALEVFMVERHYAIDFASGALVFPGGRVDPPDHDLALRPEHCPPADGQDAVAMAIRVAAIRETFEECGVLLARPRGSDQLVPAAQLSAIALRHRDDLCHSRITLAEIAEQEDLVLATDVLVPFAHWITPVEQAKRFDTHFFLAVAPADQVAEHDGHESVDSVWIEPAQALAGVDTGRFKMVFATHMNLSKLGRSATMEGAMAAARAARVVTVQPVRLHTEGSQRRLRIPLDADYGGEES
jgi:8-oxo-dGTP pyrophosphatase MutT (NUDIX family)